MKYRVKIGFHGDVFFVVSAAGKQAEDKIEKIFYSKSKAEEWADEANTARSYAEH